MFGEKSAWVIILTVPKSRNIMDESCELKTRKPKLIFLKTVYCNQGLSCARIIYTYILIIHISLAKSHYIQPLIILTRDYCFHVCTHRWNLLYEHTHTHLYVRIYRCIVSTWKICNYYYIGTKFTRVRMCDLCLRAGVCVFTFGFMVYE